MAVIRRKKDSGFLEDLSDIHNKFGKNYPIDLKSILDEFNIQLVFDPDLDNQESGYISYNDEEWIIGVNADHHKNRQRFTIAHELGHYMLHRIEIEKLGKISDAILFRKNETNRLEIEANNFASDLLMPEEEFRKKINDGTTIINDIAQYFGVSSLAVRYRAKNLGYGGHGV